MRELRISAPNESRQPCLPERDHLLPSHAPSHLVPGLVSLLLCLFLALYKNPITVSDQVCSHLDCLPTLYEILGFSDPFAALGESVLRKKEGCAVVKKGDIMGIISKNGIVLHNLQERMQVIALRGDLPSTGFDQLERRLLAFDQVTNELLQANRWAPPEANPHISCSPTAAP